MDKQTIVGATDGRRLLTLKKTKIIRQFRLNESTKRKFGSPKNQGSTDSFDENKKKSADTPVNSQDTTDNLFKASFIVGIGMPQRFRTLYIFYAIIMKFLLLIYLPLGFTLLFFTISTEDANISNLLTSLQVIYDVYGGTVKFIVLSFLLLRLRKTYALTNRLDMRCQAPDEIVELHRMVRFGQKVVLFFLTTFLSYSVSTFLGAVIKGHPPYAMYYPFLEWRRSKIEFYLVSFFDFFLMDLACIQQTVNDAYPVVYINILRTHMKTLLLRIEKLGTGSLEQNLLELKLCIKDHQLLIELYNVIAPMTSITIFVQFAVSAICIGTALINIVIFSNEFSSRIGSCFYILAVIVEIFPTCYYAQCLIDDSNQMSGVIFHSNWVDQSKEYRQLLIFFIQRTQQPMFLTAGKLFPVTLNSFLSVRVMAENQKPIGWLLYGYGMAPLIDYIDSYKVGRISCYKITDNAPMTPALLRSAPWLIAKFSFSLYTLIEQMNLKERLGIE